MKPRIPRSLRILVTDAGTRAALGAMRSLGRAGHTVVASCCEGLEPPSISSRYCSELLHYPNPHRDQSLFREWLSERGCMFDAILPISETSIVGVAAIRKNLPKNVVTVLPSDRALEFTLSKFHATRLALDLGIPCPTTAFLSNGNLSCDASGLEGLRFPIIIKIDNYFTEGGGYARGKHFVAEDAVQADEILNNLRDVRTRLIAQELLPGSGAGAYLLRFHGKTYLSFTHRRLHEVPYSGGASSFRESARDEELVQLGERLLEAIDYAGVAMIEFRRDTRDQRPYFLEINGRLWGSLALALHCGLDFPAALVHCHAFGSPPPQPQSYRFGLRCRNVFPGEVHHLMSILKANKKPRRDRPPPRLYAIALFLALFFNPNIRHDYFWWSDPVPGIRQAWEMIRWFGRKLVKVGYKKLRNYRESSVKELRKSLNPGPRRRSPSLINSRAGDAWPRG